MSNATQASTDFRTHMLKQDLFLSGLIVLSPLLLYLHHWLPEIGEASIIKNIRATRTFMPENINMFQIGQKVFCVLIFSTWFITTTNAWRFSVFILTTYTQYKLLHFLFYEFGLHHHLLFNMVLSLSLVVLLYLDKRIHYQQRNLFKLINVQDADLWYYKNLTREKIDENKIEIDLLLGERHHFRDKNLLKRLLTKAHALEHSFSKKAEVATLGPNPALKKRKHLFFQGLMLFIVTVSLIILENITSFSPADTIIRRTTLFTFQANHFSSVQIFMSVFSTKLHMFVTLTLWFFSCKFWWRYAILIPFSVITFQLLQLCTNKSLWVDENEIRMTLTLVLPLIIFMVWISKKINYYLRTWELRMFLEKEIQSLVIEMASMPAKNNFKEELNYLMEHKRNFTLNAYLKKLKVLKDKFHKD